MFFSQDSDQAFLDADRVLKRRKGAVLGLCPSLDHGVGHLWPLSMTAEPFSMSLFAPCMIVARFQHISHVCHR
jgi:hypothetical protein